MKQIYQITAGRKDFDHRVKVSILAFIAFAAVNSRMQRATRLITLLETFLQVEGSPLRT